MFVKICGMTRDVDIPPAIAAGATHLGMIFAPKSPRVIPIEDAVLLRRVIPQEITPVGVFKDQSIQEVLEIAQRVNLPWVQLHGGFDPKDINILHNEGLRVIWAAPVRPNGDYDPLPDNADLLLLDTAIDGQFGGSGAAFSWKDTLPPAQPFLVAGGLAPHNVARALEAVPSAGIDLSSGVEAAPGIKSHALLRAFGHAIRPFHTPLTIEATPSPSPSSSNSEVPS